MKTNKIELRKKRFVSEAGDQMIKHDRVNV